MTPLVKEVASIGLGLDLACVWFDVGTMPRFTFAWSELPGERLPFDDCAIVGRDGRGDKFLVHAVEQDVGVILLEAWALTGRPGRIPAFAVVMDEEKGGCYIAGIDGEPEVAKATAAPFVGILVGFLRAVNPAGYRASAKPASLTNKRRAANGKPALVFDWVTVAVAPTAEKGAPLGGTHASPRQHVRRGHWRTCANGRRVWVRDCTVGDPARGAVFKDYALRVAA